MDDTQLHFTFTYDGQDRLIREDHENFWIYFGDNVYLYDDAGNLVSHQYYWGGDPLPYRQNDYTYGPDGELLSDTFLVPNFGGTAMEEAYIHQYMSNYDGYGRLAERFLYSRWAPDSGLIDTQFGTYPAGECITVTRYYYDSQSRLVELATITAPQSRVSPSDTSNLNRYGWESIHYNYDHPIFRLKGDGATMDQIAIVDSVGHEIWQCTLGFDSVQTDADGYITRIVSDDGSTTVDITYAYPIADGQMGVFDNSESHLCTLDSGKTVGGTVWNLKNPLDDCVSLTIHLDISEHISGNVYGEWGFWVHDIHKGWLLADVFDYTGNTTWAILEFDEPLSFDKILIPCHVLGDTWEFHYTFWMTDAWCLAGQRSGR